MTASMESQASYRSAAFYESELPLVGASAPALGGRKWISSLRCGKEVPIHRHGRVTVQCQQPVDVVPFSPLERPALLDMIRTMARRRAVRVLAGLTALVCVAGVGAAAYFVGGADALSSLSVQRVTPTELARAMRADTFYSSFRESSLVLHGVVSSVSSDHGATIIAFKTTTPFGVSCRLRPTETAPTSGTAITVVSEGNNAVRSTAEVLLTGCLVSNPSSLKRGPNR